MGSKTTKPLEASASVPKQDVKTGCVAHSQFIIANAGKLGHHYDMGSKTIGEGAYGSVRIGTNRATNSVRAVKTISKARMKNIENFKREIAIMKIMDHPNIIRLFETFEDRKNIYLVMELCSGGELFDRIVEAGNFTEVQAAILMQQIVRAIFYMHANHVCHRDLKPENFIFMTKDPIETASLKIIDFGLSCWFKEGQVLTTKAGTPYYVAPEVLAGKYDHTSDLWGIGVIMFVLLSGYPPFYGETDQDVLAMVTKGAFCFDPAYWRGVSQEAKDLIKKLLTLKPSDRITAEQALNHVWIKDTAPSAGDGALHTGLFNNLQDFRKQNKLKKAALHIMANQLDEGQITALRNTFLSLDKNQDGQLTLQEIEVGMQMSGLEEISDLKAIMFEIDSDGSGVIDYTEFLAAALDKRIYLREDVCWNAFRVFDRNGDGVISQDELKIVLADDGVETVVGQKAIADLLKEIDGNSDGKIDFQEFMAMMRDRATSEAP